MASCNEIGNLRRDLRICVVSSKAQNPLLKRDQKAKDNKFHLTGGLKIFSTIENCRGKTQRNYCKRNIKYEKIPN